MQSSLPAPSGGAAMDDYIAWLREEGGVGTQPVPLSHAREGLSAVDGERISGLQRISVGRTLNARDPLLSIRVVLFRQKSETKERREAFSFVSV